MPYWVSLTFPASAKVAIRLALVAVESTSSAL